MHMNKYCYEKYELHAQKGRIFHGYVSVQADCKEDALAQAQHQAGAHMKLMPVYINPADDYAR